MLIEQTLFGTIDKVQTAIERLKQKDQDELTLLSEAESEDT